MRFNHVMRSFAVAAAVSCAAFIAAQTSAVAFAIASPTEGQVVRGRVPIVISRASLPQSVSATGFVAIKINGEFVAAVGASDQSSDTPSDKIEFVWDTKALTGDPARGEAHPFADGKYDLVIEAHAKQDHQRDAIVETAKVSVNVKNKIDQSNPAPAINLRYKFLLGQMSNYRFSTSGEFYDKYGFTLSGGQPPILGEFTVGQSIEDARHDGTALVRYKVDRDSSPFAQNPGDAIKMLAKDQRFRSIYRILDSSAKLVEANVFSTKTTGDVSECLLGMPGAGVRVGANWPNTLHMKLEGITEPADLTGTSTLDSLEWEGGLECAKIVSNLSGTVYFQFLPSAPVPVTCTSTAFFAYKLHKLIKNVMTLEFMANVDSSTLGKIQSDPSSSGQSSAASSAPPSYNPMSGYYSGATAAASTPATQQTGTPVKVRVTVTEELVRK